MVDSFPTLIKRILNLGTKYSESPLQKKRTVIFNYLLLLGILLGIILGLLMLFLELQNQTILCFLGSSLFIIFFYLNSRGHIVVSTIFFYSLF